MRPPLNALVGPGMPGMNMYVAPTSREMCRAHVSLLPTGRLLLTSQLAVSDLPVFECHMKKFHPKFCPPPVPSQMLLVCIPKQGKSWFDNTESICVGIKRKVQNLFNSFILIK